MSGIRHHRAVVSRSRWLFDPRAADIQAIEGMKSSIFHLGQVGDGNFFFFFFKWQKKGVKEKEKEKKKHWGKEHVYGTAFAPVSAVA